MKKRPILWLCLAAAAGCGALWLRLRGLDVGTVLAWIPRRPTAAIPVLLALFAAKGLSFFFPLAVLEAAGGLLFPMPLALTVNLLGVTAAASLPYLLGRRTQGGLDALAVRFPRLRRLREIRQDSDFLFVTLIRLTGVFPFDAVSFYLGAAGVAYPAFLPATLLGALPHLTAVTILGSALSHPSGEALLVSLCVNAAVTAGALTVWRIQKRRRAA